MRIMRAVLAASVLLGAVGLQGQAPPEVRPDAPPAAAPPRPPRPGERQFDPAAVQRGQELLTARCGFCHGTNARGGAGGGSDLTRSPIVQEDEDGQQIDAFLKVGRPERNMPKFELTGAEVKDLATFLHSAIYLAANRRFYQLLDVLQGDAKAGQAFFAGRGGCTACHSPTGDLAGVGAKYDAATLQQRVVMPRGTGRGGGPPGPGGFSPPHLERNALKATVTLASGEAFTGALVRSTDFEVTLYDPETRRIRTWLRRDDLPKVVVSDPLQAHVERLRKWTDTDMHDVTAYLAGLK